MTPRSSALVKFSAQEALKRGLVQTVTQWTPGIKPTWTIREVRSALRLHAIGNFSLSSLLVDTMGEDDSIPGLLEKLIDSVLGKEFSLDPVEEPSKQRKLSEAIAKDAGPIWWDMFPEAELYEFFAWYEMLGVAVAVLDWDKTDPTRWIPHFRTLHPQFLWRDQAQRKWFYTAQEGVLEVTPGDGTWVLLTDGQRGWMRGKVRAAGVPWIGKQLTIRDQGRYNERHGFPIVLARTPAIADEGDREEFWEDLQALSGETMVELPTHVDGENADAKYDLDLLEATDKSYEAFGATLERWDRRLTILFLGANQNTEVSGKVGTNASASQHKDELVDKARGIDKRATTQLRKQALWPFAAFNYSGAVIEAVPWPHWDVEPPEDTKIEAEDQKAFGEALDAVQKAGFDVENVEDLAEKHGLKLARRAAEPVAPGGKSPSGNPNADPEEDGEPPDADETETEVDPEASALVLASGASPLANSGFLDGQLYIDALAERSSVAGAKALSPDVKTVLGVIAQAHDYDDLRSRLRKAFASMDPERLSALVEKAIILSQLAGRAAVLQDL